MIELATSELLDVKKALSYNEIFDRVAELKEFSAEEKKENIAQFYTDLNVDGRFITIGQNMWGLKRWYPVEQMDEEVTAAPKKKKKAKVTKTKKTKTKKEKEEEAEQDVDLIDEAVTDMVDEEEMDQALKEADPVDPEEEEAITEEVKVDDDMDEK
nr:DNA-directed RNA polymerase subunit delta [Virgibacillus natechei]